MGFRWQFEQNSHHLLDNLYSNLTEVFKKPFAGYLLFLVGGADLDLLRWIEDKIITLDSLTGEDIAFVIFAERFKLNLKSRKELGYSESVGRYLVLRDHPKQKNLHLDDIKNSYESFGEITPLVESGQPKWIIDDDEITGVTYAVDDIARKLGILNEVPCVLVFDSIPSEKYKILNLNQDNVQELIPLLRTAISNLRNNESYQNFMAFKDQYSYLEHIKNKKRIILDKIRELNSNKLVSTKEFKNLRESLSKDELNLQELPVLAFQELEKSSDQINLIDSKIENCLQELKYFEQKINEFYQLKAKLIQNVPSFISSLEKAQVDLQFSDGHVKERDTVSNNWFYDDIDAVNFTLLPPQKISMGATILLELWIYSKNQSQEFSHLLNSRRLDEFNYYSAAFSSKELGEKISFIITIEDLIVENPHQEFRWVGEIAKIDFSVIVPSDIKEGIKKGKIKIFVRALEISEINFSISVKEESIKSKLETEETRFVKAFISYSNRDINKVIGRIQGILKTSPEMEIIMDKKDMRSGDKWKTKLREFIEEADIFYLFWSKNALESEWVNKEWKCAYKLKGIDFIDPIPLESPDIVPPPDELSDMHFNDWILAFMQSNQ